MRLYSSSGWRVLPLRHPAVRPRFRARRLAPSGLPSVAESSGRAAGTLAPRHPPTGLIIVLVLWVATIAVETAWAFGFSVEPSRIELVVPAGKRRGQTLVVKNDRSEPMHLTTYVRDVAYLPDGTSDFPPEGSTDWSCARWVHVVPGELEIPAQSSQEVRVSVIAPPEASGGRYAMVFFETGPSYAQGDGIGVNFRIGALIQAVIPGTERYAASLKNVVFTPPGQIRTDVFNSGNLLVRPKGQIKIFEAGGKKVRHAPFNPTLVGVLPSTLRSFSSTLEEPLPSGSYRNKVEVDYGARNILVGERSFEVP